MYDNDYGAITTTMDTHSQRFDAERFSDLVETLDTKNLCIGDIETAIHWIKNGASGNIAHEKSREVAAWDEYDATADALLTYAQQTVKPSLEVKCLQNPDEGSYLIEVRSPQFPASHKGAKMVLNYLGLMREIAKGKDSIFLQVSTRMLSARIRNGYIPGSDPGNVRGTSLYDVHDFYDVSGNRLDHLVAAGYDYRGEPTTRQMNRKSAERAVTNMQSFAGKVGAGFTVEWKNQLTTEGQPVT